MERTNSHLSVIHAESKGSGHYAHVMKAIQRLLERGEINYRQASDVMREQADEAAKEVPREED